MDASALTRLLIAILGAAVAVVLHAGVLLVRELRDEVRHPSAPHAVAPEDHRRLVALLVSLLVVLSAAAVWVGLALLE